MRAKLVQTKEVKSLVRELDQQLFPEDFVESLLSPDMEEEVAQLKLAEDCGAVVWFLTEENKYER